MALRKIHPKTQLNNNNPSTKNKLKPSPSKIRKLKFRTHMHNRIRRQKPITCTLQSTSQLCHRDHLIRDQTVTSMHASTKVEQKSTAAQSRAKPYKKEIS